MVKIQYLRQQSPSECMNQRQTSLVIVVALITCAGCANLASLLVGPRTTRSGAFVVAPFVTEQAVRDGVAVHPSTGGTTKVDSDTPLTAGGNLRSPSKADTDAAATKSLTTTEMSASSLVATASPPLSATSKKRIDIDSSSMCFVTSEFSERVEDADTLPVIPADMQTQPSRHFVFTNLDLSAAEAVGWTAVHMVDTELPYKRQITKSRWPKFMGRKHAALKHCEIIFYGDAHFMNPVNETAWLKMARNIRKSSVGLMQNKQVGRKDHDGPVQELLHNARIGKDSWATANATIDWLRNQTDYEINTRVYKNALFGYDPHNPRFQAFVDEFWQQYSKERGSWRDQPYSAYYLKKHKMEPLSFANPVPMGPAGKQGHNGHTYVPTNDPPSRGIK